MTDEKPQKNPLGPTGQRVRENVRHLRGRLPYRELAERLERLGRPIPTLGLSRIENGARRVDADDLVALALALGVNPNRLLLSVDDLDDQEIDVTSAFTARPYQLWAWARGEQELLPAVIARGEGERPFGEVQEEFLRASLPASDRARTNHTAVRAAQDVLDGVRAMLDRLESPDRFVPLASPLGKTLADAGLGNTPASLRAQLRRLIAEVDALLESVDGER